MISDVAAFGLLFPQLGPATNTEAAGYLGEAGLGLYALGGPIVHWAHGEVGAGFGSLGLRVVLPLAAVIAFVSACWDKCSSAQADGLGVALLLPGMFAPSIIDYALLAFEPAPAPRTSRAQPIRLAPALGSIRDAQRHVVPTLSLAVRGF
jgi:hypothetical protein